MIKGILVDIDGTLVKSNDAHTDSWQKSFKEFGYDIPFEKIRALVGMGGDKIIPSLIPGLDSDSGKGKEISDYRKRLFSEVYSPRLQPQPGARDLIQSLFQKGLKVIAATSSHASSIPDLLRAAGVDDLIKEYTTGSDVERSKPDPDIIDAALKKIGLPPEEVLLIGDTPYDISAGNKAGVKVVGVRCGGFDDIALKDAYKIFDDPRDILSNLEEILL